MNTSEDLKEITSKKTSKIQIVSKEVWDWIVAQGKQKLFKVKDIPTRKLVTPPTIIKPPEIKTKKSHG